MKSSRKSFFSFSDCDFNFHIFGNDFTLATGGAFKVCEVASFALCKNSTQVYDPLSIDEVFAVAKMEEIKGSPLILLRLKPRGNGLNFVSLLEYHRAGKIFKATFHIHIANTGYYLSSGEATIFMTPHAEASADVLKLYVSMGSHCKLHRISAKYNDYL